MKLLMQNQNINTIILVSGDRDFIPLLNELRSLGKNTFLMGVPGSISRDLVTVADGVIKYQPEKIGGGNAMKLLPSILVTLKKYSLYEFPNKKGKEKGDIIGNEITATTIKNRGYPPFQDATINIDFKDGVKSFAGLLDLAIL